MAAFRIHEDIENQNENIIESKTISISGKINDKQSRTTFAVLTNVQHGVRTHALKTGNDVGSLKAKIINDENKIPDNLKFVEEKNDALPPVDKFKAFNVVETKANFNEQQIELEKANSSQNITAFRQPLKEIIPETGETPVSISEIVSPMSIDKSIVLEDTPKHIRSIRDRFFDVEEYQHDILKYLRESEIKHRPNCRYMTKQPDITNSMRTILIDWLVEVAEEYKLHSESLYLAVAYIDRFLSVMSVVRAKLQLVGTAAMFIASKYEEIYPPDVSEFIYITDNTYSRTQVFRMEQLLLKALTFDLFVPTSSTFLSIYATITEMPDQCKFLAMYISELSLLQADPYLKYLPSLISAASVALARYNLDMTIWSSKLEEITSYPLDSLKEVIFHLSRTHMASVNSPQQAVQDKYRAPKYKEVSTIRPSLLDEESYVVAVMRLKESDEDDEINIEISNVRKITSTLHFL